LNHFSGVGVALAARTQPAKVNAEFRVEAASLQRFSFGILIAFLFMIFSRIFDVQLSWLHLPGISYRIMGVFVVMSGAFIAAFRDPIGKCVLAFTACFLIAIPFSVWKGGSFHTFTEQWLVGFIVFVATAALISDFGQYIRTVKTVAFAILILTVICISLGTVRNGRLFLAHGRFASPNEIAQALLLGLPFWWAICSNAKSLGSRLFGGIAMVLMLYVIGNTGSRGALISMVVIAGVMFVRGTVVGKAKVLAGSVLLLLFALVTLPDGLKVRYQTFFTAEQADGPEDDADSQLIGSAVAATNSRMQMFIRSLVLTAQHPILGVGPGMFIVAEDNLAKTEGARSGSWLGTHNTFTQVSSECGIPALLFYSAIVVLSLKKTYALCRQTQHRPEFKQICTHALALNYSLLAFLFTGMFVHAAYSSLLPVLSGLTISLLRSANVLLAQDPAAPASAGVAFYPVSAPRLSAVRSV
jgi:O-antigen ligase